MGLPKLDRPRNHVNARRAAGALLGCLLLVGCSRSARPVPVPQDLAPWPTVLESARRDAGLDASAPERPVRAWSVGLGRGVMGPLAIRSDLLVATSVDRHLVVLDASSGSYFWERRVRGAAPAGAVFDRASVYIAGQDREGAAEAYELARGFLVWRRDMPPPIGAPLLHEGVTYWGTEDGRVYALAAADGREQWLARLHGGVVATPVADGSHLLVATNADTLYRIDMRNGDISHRLPLPATVSATPAFDGRMLHLPMHDTTHLVVDAADWRVVRVERLDAVVRAAPVLDRDGSALLLTDHATVWRIAEGMALERVVALAGAARGSLALAANGILVGRLDGALFLLRRDGAVVWREDFDDSIEAPVAVYRGAVYVPLLRGGLVKLMQAAGS